MTEEILILVRYRLERSRESLKEAKILLEQGHANTFVNRLYYACFYAVSALLLLNGFFSSKHSGIRSLFHQKFIRTGLVAQGLGKLYGRLFNKRQEGDYSDLVLFEVKEVSNWYEEAKEFVETVEEIIKKEIHKK